MGARRAREVARHLRGGPRSTPTGVAEPVADRERAQRSGDAVAGLKRSGQALWRLVKRVSARRSLPSSLTPSTWLLPTGSFERANAMVFALQGLMGHSQLGTTRTYLDEIGTSSSTTS